MPTVAGIIQLVGLAPAVVAIYQFATHTGELVAGEIRSNGTFSHPNGAAMFFAIAATVSIWKYMDGGRRRRDMAFGALFAVAILTTFSIGGLASFLVMLMLFGTLRPGSVRIKLGAYAIAALTVVAFALTPLGAERIANESTTQLASNRGAPSTSLGWRFYKWKLLISEWEREPIYGQGLGTTVTAEGTSENITAGKVPHNEYLRYLVETGAVGLLTLLGAIVLLLRRLLQRRKVGVASNAVNLGIAVLGGCLFNALGDNTFLYSNTGYAAALIVTAALFAGSRSAMRGSPA
jgi:O-antigen ligase